jgi:tRNA (cmo5U34)-methyltransferase
MEQIETSRFFTMAETYDKMAQILVPQYDLLQGDVFNIIGFEKNYPLVVVDLGAGSGIFLEKVLSTYPNSFCYWIDFSLDFMKVAQNRLESYGDRVKYILSPLEKDWETKLIEKPDLIFSMSAIHHLEKQEKIKLYQKCFRFLNRSGWFFNADEMKTIKKEPYKNSLMFWANYIIHKKDKVPNELKPFYEKWNIHFENWKLRNITNFGLPKIKGDDIHESFLDQLEWLHDAGFVNEDLFMKYHLWGLIGGQKVVSI